MQDLWQGYQARLELPVAWGEMDAAQHVNNVIYFRYSESGRLEYFRKIDFEVDVQDVQNPIGPILAEISCKYKAPLTYPDQITVATRVPLDSFDEYSFWSEQIIISHAKKRIVAELKARLVSYNYQTLKKAPLPREVKEKITAIERPS
ncbi:MAG: thioesterase family protein [Bacteroidota bacterium]